MKNCPICGLADCKNSPCIIFGDEKIKEKVREIQHKYCGEAVETKLYYAIKETLDRFRDL